MSLYNTIRKVIDEAGYHLQYHERQTLASDVQAAVIPFTAGPYAIQFDPGMGSPWRDWKDETFPTAKGAMDWALAEIDDVYPWRIVDGGRHVIVRFDDEIAAKRRSGQEAAK